MALSSLIQTRSMELVLAPIASHVSQLVTIPEARGKASYPGLMHAAVSVMDAVQNLSNTAQTVASESNDEQLQSDMPVVIEMALKAAEQILEAAGRLAEHPHSKDVQLMLVRGSYGVLEGTMKILLVWDSAEVNKIVQTAQWVMDRLELVQGSKSMRSLVICFGGFSEAMMPLLKMTDKRQMELTNPDQKKCLLAALTHVKKYLPTFTAAMQNYVKSPSAASKESKDSLAREISTGIHNLIKAVKIYDDDEEEDEEREGTDNMASNIIHIQRKLATSERFFIGSELDKHLREIDQNSRAVAHVSRPHYKTKITGLCDELILLRQKLGEQQEMVHANPESARYRAAFDETAETMCDKLLELDHWVADSVVDQVTNTFVETSGPINHLVQAATAAGTRWTTATPKTAQSATTVTTSPLNQPMVSSASQPGTSSQLEESLKGLDDEVKLFRRHSRRMSQVAAYAAQSSADSKRVSLIKDLADEVDSMTSEVVSAALDVRRTPGSKETREKLDSLRQSWASKVQELTAAIDDVIDPEDFVTISEANIQQDMARCRDAIQNGRWAELIGIVQGIAAKAQRIAEVGRATIENASDQSYKTALSRAVEALEQAIPKMLSLANEVASDPSNQHTISDFIMSLRELLSSIHDIQEELSRGIDVPEQDEEEEVDIGGAEDLDPFTSTPMTTTAHERMMRKNLERMRSQPRYIGGLGKRLLPTPKTPEGEPQLQASPHKHGREDSVLSFSEGFSQSFNSGDAETQTPRRKMKDQFSQVELQHLSTNATLGSPGRQSEPFSPLSLSTASWTTPTPSSPVQADTPSPLVQTSPPRQLPVTPAEKTMKSYVSPLQHLVSAAKRGDMAQLPGHASALSARAIRLTEFAQSAADTVKDDSGLIKILKVKSSEVNLLTPRMIEQAEEVAKDPHQRRKLQDLEATSHQWAGHVKQLIDATQQANLPWSKTAERLKTAAKSEVGLQTQLDHVSTQTNRMVDIATMTMKAAATEEAIGFVEHSDSGDSELQEQVQKVKVTTSEIQKLTPQLLSAAKVASGKQESSAAVERLNLLSEEWATKAKVLMKSVDDVSLGMGGAADTLFISARSGDEGLLTEQTKSIQTLASSLHDIAQDSVERCTDAEKVKVVRVAARNIVKLSTRLIECANAVAEDCKGAAAQPSQRNVENVELLRRDWAAQVHLLTAHIDDITAEMSSPLDHLVDVALQASQRSGMAKQHLMDQFESKASFMSDQLQLVCELFNEATDSVTTGEPAIEKADTALVLLKKLTPHAIGAARSLGTEPGSAMLEHFNHLRRQWSSKAQAFLANLQKITSADVDRVLNAFDELLHLSKRISVVTSPIPKSYSDEDVSHLEEKSTNTEFVVKEPSTPKITKPNPTDSEVILRKKTPQSPRHTSMAIPLPSWNINTSVESALDVSSRSIAFAAQSLKDITDDFVEDNNPIVDVAKKMAEQMSQMADYTRGRGDLQNKEDMIHTAKAIAANGQAIVRFANIISELCTDKKTKASLQSCAEMIPTLSTQLRIIASVKASTPDDTSADVMLVKNAQNLMRAVIRTVHAAEAACMKGLNAPEGDSEAASLAMNWKHKLYHQRTMETIRAPRGEKGLRKLDKNHISTPSVVDSIKPAASAMVSPTRLTATTGFR